MKQPNASSNKNRFFPKQYTPAEVAAERKRSRTTSGKIVNSLNQKTQKLRDNLTQKTKRKRTTSTRTKVEKSITPAPKKSASSKKATKQTSRLGWPEWALLGIISTLTIVIAFTLIYCKVCDPVRLGDQELERLARDYYIEYVYPNTLGDDSSHPEIVMADYELAGMPIVRLRQLLLHDTAQYAKSSQYFDNNYYHCDPNQTYVQYFPVAPYGPQDFTTVYSKNCEKVGKLD